MMRKTPHDSDQPWRQLGCSDLRIRPLVIGTMARRGDNREVRLAIYREAIELGLTTFDTAPLYGFGAADRLLGEALRGIPRQSVQILSKVGLRWDDGARGKVLFEFRDAQGVRRAVRRDSRPAAIQQDVEESLTRLGIDCLDLVQVHHPDPDTPIQQTMDSLLDLRRQGMIREIGTSNFSVAQVRTATQSLGSSLLASTQESFSLIDRSIEPEILPFCSRHGISILAYSPLAGGLLGGNRRVRHAGFETARREVLGVMASRYGVEPATLALAWTLFRKGVTSAIAGVSSVEQLRTISPASRLDLSTDDATALDAAFRGIDMRMLQTDGTTLLQRTYRRTRRLVGASLRRFGIEPSTWRSRDRDDWR